MCTLIALHRVDARAPLVVAANRDEFFDRPAEGPALRHTPHGVIAAPLDLEAGGTWFGVNRAGLFAAVTNVACADPDPKRRSRGLLVVDALGAASALEAAEKAESLSLGAYNPFNLFLADREQAFAITYEERPRRIESAAGVFAIGNTALDATPSPKLSRLREQVERVASGPQDSLLEQLAGLCRSHDGSGLPLSDVCVHTERYGTRSSALLRLGAEGLDDLYSDFRFADGAPCQSQYGDFTPLLRELGRTSRFDEGESVARSVS
jgi:uncharacterized protein with NRDE domain